MNISKHMEAIFVAVTVVLCSYAYQADNQASDAVVTDTAVQQNSASEQAAVQTVVITAKRG